MMVSCKKIELTLNKDIEEFLDMLAYEFKIPEHKGDIICSETYVAIILPDTENYNKANMIVIPPGEAENAINDIKNTLSWKMVSDYKEEEDYIDVTQIDPLAGYLPTVISPLHGSVVVEKKLVNGVVKIDSMSIEGEIKFDTKMVTGEIEASRPKLLSGKVVISKSS